MVYHECELVKTPYNIQCSSKLSKAGRCNFSSLDANSIAEWNHMEILNSDFVTNKYGVNVCLVITNQASKANISPNQIYVQIQFL